MTLLIKNGFVVTESGCTRQDILLKNRKIEAISNSIDVQSSEVIDAADKYVIPGGIDVHTHLCLDTGSFVAQDDFYTGTVAAACGGTTAIIDHPGFGPEGCRLTHQIDKYHNLASGNSVIDYSFHGVIQHINSDILKDIPELISQGVSSFKAYLTYDYKLSDREIIKLMEVLRDSNGLLAVHCENNDILSYYRKKLIDEGKTGPGYHPISRSEICESEAVNRMICLSKYTNNSPLYIVHLSTELGLKYFRELNDINSSVFLETCIQYLLLNDSYYSRKDALKYILSPPLRKNNNLDALWKGINDGDISVVATDHCPFDYKLRKSVAIDDFTKCPNGLPGIENRIPLMFSEGVMKNRISIEKFVAINCTNPAKIMGLYPKKGVIKVGSDADLVIIDPNRKTTISNKMLHHNVDYSPYEGMELTGYPETTISNGRVIAKNNKFIGCKGYGNFLKRMPFDRNINLA